MSTLSYSRIGEIVKGQGIDAPPVVQCFNDVKTVVNGDLDNANIKAGAAIALSKLATGVLPTGITVASANIVDGTIVNADVNSSAAIAGSKLALADTIVNADIKTTAAIATTKMAFTAPTGTTTIIGSMWGYLGTTTPSVKSVKTATAWIDYDCDLDTTQVVNTTGPFTLPTGPVIVILEVSIDSCISGGSNLIYFRTNGSTWGQTTGTPALENSLTVGIPVFRTLMIATDSDHKFEYMVVGSPTIYCRFALMGYIGPIPK